MSVTLAEVLGLVAASKWDQAPNDAILAALHSPDGEERVLAMNALVRRVGLPVYRICRQLGNEADALDAFQQTFLTFWQLAPERRAQVRDVAAYLGQVARNAVNLTLRQRQRRREVPLEQHSRAEPMACSVEAEDWGEVLAEEVSRLPEEARAAFCLRHVEKLRWAEVALRLGVAKSTAQQWVENAEAALEVHLRSRGVEPKSLPAHFVAAAVERGLAVLGEVGAVPAFLAWKWCFVAVATLVVGGLVAWGLSPAEPLRRESPAPVAQPHPLEAPLRDRVVPEVLAILERLGGKAELRSAAIDREAGRAVVVIDWELPLFGKRALEFRYRWAAQELELFTNLVSEQMKPVKFDKPILVILYYGAGGYTFHLRIEALQEIERVFHRLGPAE